MEEVDSVLSEQDDKRLGDSVVLMLHSEVDILVVQGISASFRESLFFSVYFRPCCGLNVSLNNFLISSS